MLLLLFNASRTLSYRSDLGVLASYRHGGGESPNMKDRVQEKKKLNISENQHHMLSKSNLAAWDNSNIINPLGQTNSVVFCFSSTQLEMHWCNEQPHTEETANV